MRRILFLLPVLGCLFFGFTNPAGEPWKADELMKPLTLAQMIQDGKAPVIINVGPMKMIKGAIGNAPAGQAEGMAVFRKKAARLDKQKMVVVYCGCCTAQNCPNIRPSFTYLKAQGFTSVRLLDIETGLYPDWVDKGYPMED